MERISRLRQLSVVSVILLAATLAQTALAATTIEKYDFSGDSVSASWSSTDNCSSYYFSLTASTYAYKKNVPPAQSALIYIDIYDYCTGASSMGYSEANPAWFQLLVGNTRTASLKGNIPMQWTSWDPISGYNNYGGNAAIDLQWNGNGNPQRTTDKSRNHSLNFMSFRRFTGLSTSATVSGSVTLDGNPCPLVESANASISNSVTGEMMIWRSGGQPQQATTLTPTSDGNADMLRPLPRGVVYSRK